MADEKSGVPERATGALLAPRPTSKSLDPDTALRPVIHESWRRCTAAHLDPEPARLEVRRVAADELDRRIERNAELLEVARPHLAWLSSAFASVEHLAAIVDLDGVVLHTTGTDAGAIASIGAPGHEWSEALMGTNGIGTAIVAGAPVAVSGAEHFVRPLHCFACTGAPIRDASGRIAGAINLTSREPEAPAGRLTVVAHAAYAIEQELRHRESLRGTRGTLDSERRLAEALRQSEARFRSLSASSPVGIFQADSEGFVTYANARVLQIFALSEEEGLGHGWISRIHPEDAQAVISGWSAALQRQAEYNHEYRLLMPDGTINWVHCRSAPMFDGAGAMIGNVGTIEDITVRRALESQLRQAQKMEAVGQLAGGVAHDFNNLLTVIKVHAELALDELQASHPLHTDLVEVRKAADRASGLTRQLLAFSRKQLLQPEVLNLNEVVAGLEPMLRRLIGEDIRVLAELDQSIARVHADPGQLEQVIVNLAVNARDAMADGGTLTIRTCEVAMSEADVRRHAGMGAGRYVVLEVVDTGCGMTPEVRERIFEPFFTTKSAGHGTGLGLATVYGILRQSGGHVVVQSAPGQGSTFRVFLPPAAGARGHPSQPQAAAESPRGAETVLVVEDEEAVRALACRILERQGYTVLDARNGEAALVLARSTPGRRIDLVVTDMVMPGMNGRALAEAMVAARPDVRVLFMSGYTDDEIVRRGLRDADVSLLQKPFTADGLACAVRAALAPVG